MTLPVSGPISLGAVNTEIGAVTTATLSLNDQSVRNLAQTPLGILAPNITISLSNLLGRTWSPPKILGGTAGPVCVKVTASGDRWVGGLGGVWAGTPSWWVARLNSAGVIQWQRQLTVASLIDLDLDTAGNVYVLGADNASASGSQGFVLAKYNASGVLQFQRRYGGTGTISWYAESISVDAATGNLVYAASAPITGNVSYLVSYGATGTLGFVRTLTCTVNGSNSSRSYAVARDTAGNIFWCGRVDNNITPFNKGYLVKYNSAGTLQWQIAYADSSATSVATDTAGNVYVGIYKENAFGGAPSLTKINTSGTVQWQRLFGQNTGSFPLVAVEQSTGAVYGYNSGYLVKYNTSGVVQWARQIYSRNYTNTPAPTGGAISGVVFACYKMTVDTAGNVLLAGRDSGSPGGAIITINSAGDGIGTWGGYTMDTATVLDSVDSTAWNTLTNCTFGTGAFTSTTPTYTDSAAANTITVVV